VNEKKATVVRMVRDFMPAEITCVGSDVDFFCPFALVTSRALPEIDARKMARVHALANPGHEVMVEIRDVTRYKAGD
jgi:hypothetical protein